MTIKCPHCKEGKIFKDADGSYFCINCGLRKEPEEVYPIRKALAQVRDTTSPEIIGKMRQYYDGLNAHLRNLKKQEMEDEANEIIAEFKED